MRPLLAGEPIDLRVQAVDLRAHDARPAVRRAGRGERRGRGRLAWAQHLPRNRDARGGGARARRCDAAAAERGLGGAGRHRAGATRRVSGDRNPIHLHRLTARAFGQPAPIAHGMWTKARCLAALEGCAAGRLRRRRALPAPAAPARPRGVLVPRRRVRRPRRSLGAAATWPVASANCTVQGSIRFIRREDADGWRPECLRHRHARARPAARVRRERRSTPPARRSPAEGGTGFVHRPRREQHVPASASVYWWPLIENETAAAAPLRLAARRPPAPPRRPSNAPSLACVALGDAEVLDFERRRPARPRRENVNRRP